MSGSKPEYPEKTSDSLPANRYHIILLEEKIQRPGRESNPHPPTLVISSPGQERAPRPDPLSHRPPLTCLCNQREYSTLRSILFAAMAAYRAVALMKRHGLECDSSCASCVDDLRRTTHDFRLSRTASGRHCSTKKTQPVQFSSVQFSSRWYIRAREGPYALHPASQVFPQCCAPLKQFQCWSD